MGDDYAIHVLFGQQLIDAPAELQPDFIAHVLAVERGKLLAGDLGKVPDLRHGSNEHIYAQRSRLIAGCSRVIRCAAGNGAAGSKDYYMRFFSCVRQSASSFLGGITLQGKGFGGMGIE